MSYPDISFDRFATVFKAGEEVMTSITTLFFNRLWLWSALFLFPLAGRADIEVMNLNDDGDGSLRDAIEEAMPGETITFHSSLSGGTLRLDGTDLTIDKDLTIDGSTLDAPVTISGDNGNDGISLDDSRIFSIFSGTTVVLDSLTLTGGYKTHLYGGPDDLYDVAYMSGGAIFSEGDLTIRDSTISGNKAGDAYTHVGPSGRGGAIYQTGGDLTLVRCTINNNRAGDGASNPNNHQYGDFSMGGLGGAICIFNGSLTITECTIDGNRAGDGMGAGSMNGIAASDNEGGSGGAIFLAGSETWIMDSTISNNRAGNGSRAGKDGILPRGGSGGAIEGSSDLVAINSTFYGNRAGDGGIYSPEGMPEFLTGADGGSGGAIDNHFAGTLLLNCTVHGNQAGNGGFLNSPYFEAGGNGGNGGGIHKGAQLVYCTVTGNQAGAGSNGDTSSGDNGDGGGVHGGSTISNSIIAGNFAGTGSLNGPGSGPDLFDSVTAIGPNLIGNNDSIESDVPAAPPLVGDAMNPVDPLLDALADQGGPTLTQLPLPGSPAINAGRFSERPVDSFDIDGDSDNFAELIPIETDQRGLSRFAGAATDLGSLEVGAGPPGEDPPTMDRSTNLFRIALTRKIKKLTKKAKRFARSGKRSKAVRLKKKIKKLKKRRKRL